jgi:hypothetical protein
MIILPLPLTIFFDGDEEPKGARSEIEFFIILNKIYNTTGK